MAIDVHRAEFIRSAAGEKDFLEDLPQAALAGRSNVGKSSVLNRLLERKNFARVGSAPGRTAHINYFRIDGAFYLADLPGYGYAKVSRAERARWARLMEAYFARPQRIALGLLVVDARHRPSADDETMAGWFHQTGCPLVVVANKVDRLKKSELAPSLERIRETLLLEEATPLIPFSAEKGTGRPELLQALLQGLERG